MSEQIMIAGYFLFPRLAFVCPDTQRDDLQTKLMSSDMPLPYTQKY